MKLDKYSDYRKRLKTGRGVLIPLATKKTLYLTPFKAFGQKTSTKILITLEPNEEFPRPGVFVWDYKNPPINAAKLAIKSFPLAEAVLIHILLLLTFFPVRTPECPSLWLEYPKTKKGTFVKSRTKTPAEKPVTKKATNKYDPSRPTKIQSSHARRHASRPTVIIEADSGTP